MSERQLKEIYDKLKKRALKEGRTFDGVRPSFQISRREALEEVKEFELELLLKTPGWAFERKFRAGGYIQL